MVSCILMRPCTQQPGIQGSLDMHRAWRGEALPRATTCNHYHQCYRYMCGWISKMLMPRAIKVHASSNQPSNQVTSQRKKLLRPPIVVVIVEQPCRPVHRLRAALGQQPVGRGKGARAEEAFLHHRAWVRRTQHVMPLPAWHACVGAWEGGGGLLGDPCSKGQGWGWGGHVREEGGAAQHGRRKPPPGQGVGAAHMAMAVVGETECGVGPWHRAQASSGDSGRPRRPSQPVQHQARHSARAACTSGAVRRSSAPVHASASERVAEQEDGDGRC